MIAATATRRFVQTEDDKRWKTLNLESFLLESEAIVYINVFFQFL